MTDHRPDEPTPADFRESAKRSQEANIADESAAYVTAGERSDEEPEAEPDVGAQSSEQPVEAGEESAPRNPGSPG